MKTIYEELFKYQKRVMYQALQHNKFYLALEPGLGKTIIALAVAQKRPAIDKILIVCQHSKLDDWQIEIKKHWDINTVILRGNVKKRNKILQQFKDGALIVNYDIVWKHPQIYNLINPQWMIIIDESQYLKAEPKRNSQIAGSKIASWGITICQKATTVLLLSGTPINKPEHLYTQLKMLGMQWNWYQFQQTFLIIKEKKFTNSRWPTKVITGYKNLDSLFDAFNQKKISLKVQDAVDLPINTYSDINILLENPKDYIYAKKHHIYKDINLQNAGVLFMKLRQMASGFLENQTISKHKMIALQELLETNHHNFNIFYNFNYEKDTIKKICNKLKIKVFEINGTQKTGYQSKQYNGRFVILIQYFAGAEGLNLQHLQHTLYYSPPLSFIKYKQSQARTSRIGQTKPCFYYHFKTLNTIETNIYSNLKVGKSYDEKTFLQENVKKNL